MSRRNLLVAAVVTIVLAGASSPSDAGSVPTAPRPGKERQIECMNYYRDHLQQVSGTPFVNDCLRSSEPASAVAARLRPVGKPAGPATDVARAAAALHRDCERSRWGQHFACDCVRDAYANDKKAHPNEPDFRLQERAAAGCVSKEKIEKYVTAECLRDPAGLMVEKKDSSCACEAGETYEALLAEPGLVFDSSGNQKLLMQRRKACLSGGLQPR